MARGGRIVSGQRARVDGILERSSATARNRASGIRHRGADRAVRQSDCGAGDIGLFWANYIDQPESRDTQFLVPGKDSDDPPRLRPTGKWVRAASPEHGVLATHNAGLNFEHIHDGTVQQREILFEPRNVPMQLRVIDPRTAELYQAPTPHWGLESCLRYQLIDDEVVQQNRPAARFAV